MENTTILPGFIGLFRMWSLRRARFDRLARPVTTSVCRDIAHTLIGGANFLAKFRKAPDPARNLNWSAEGKWVHYAKVAFEKYFLHKIRRGESEPFYERWVMEGLGIRKLTRAAR